MYCIFPHSARSTGGLNNINNDNPSTDSKDLRAKVSQTPPSFSISIFPRFGLLLFALFMAL
jgi:hypothetical protein